MTDKRELSRRTFMDIMCPGNCRDIPVDDYGRVLEWDTAQREKIAALERENERLRAVVEAAKNLRIACLIADCNGELSEHVDGSLLDAVSNALAAWTKQVNLPTANQRKVTND